MKTISEAAKDYILGNRQGYPSKSEDEDTDIFTSGVKFAQQWIPVEQELPETKIEAERDIFFSEYVLVKVKGYDHPFVAFYVKENNNESFDFIHYSVDRDINRKDITHWRKIELK